MHTELREGQTMTPRLFITPDRAVSSDAKGESSSSSIIALAHPKTGNFLENHVDLFK